METKTNSQSSIYNHKSRIPKIQTSSAQNFLNLPEEIIQEILSRLPVKSLLKFRCVSKSWRSLISSKHFIKAHLEISKKDTDLTRHTIISTISPYCDTLKQCSVQPLISGLVSKAVEFDYPMKNRKNAFRIVGCCNGLVCIAISSKQFFLCNPSTRKYKKLPDVEMKWGLFMIKYGFGFDKSNDDYKVLGIWAGLGDAYIYETMVKIYSLRTNSWTRIDAFKDGLPFDDVGTFVSGKLHWRRTIGFNSNRDIFSFDLGSELCGTIEQPKYVESGFSPVLGVLGGSLCVLCHYPQSSVDVWVMKQYGVSESWSKMVSIPYVGDPINPWEERYSAHIPLCIGLKGEILLTYRSRFLVYDPKDNRFRRPKIRNFDAFIQAYIYYESLVSL